MEVDGLAGSDQRVRERVRLGAGQPFEVDRHAERRELIIGNLASRVAEHELGELIRRKLAAVALALD